MSASSQLPGGSQDERVFRRFGQLIVFNQLGVKLWLPTDLPSSAYFAWLDRMAAALPSQVRGAEIAEKPAARATPRLNTGVYYDTPSRDLVRLGAVVRTTCNKLTHAFCAFKLPVDDRGVRQDRRYVFDGDEKAALQADPTSEQSVAIVKRLLARRDVDQPGLLLQRTYGIDPATLTLSVRVALLRHPFFVWLDGKDALRCVMDRATTTDLRRSGDSASEARFAELELPLYPRVDPMIAADPRTGQLMHVLGSAAIDELTAHLITENKYQRAVAALGLNRPSEPPVA